MEVTLFSFGDSSVSESEDRFMVFRTQWNLFSEDITDLVHFTVLVPGTLRFYYYCTLSHCVLIACIGLTVTEGRVGPWVVYLDELKENAHSWLPGELDFGSCL